MKSKASHPKHSGSTSLALCRAAAAGVAAALARHGFRVPYLAEIQDAEDELATTAEEASPTLAKASKTAKTASKTATASKASTKKKASTKIAKKWYNEAHI